VETLLTIDSETWEMLGKLIGAGLALGFGGIGAAVGMGVAAGQANEGIMRQPDTQGYMLRTMLIGQAVGGSPSIFALVVGLLILFVPPARANGPAFAAAMIGAGLSIGLGCFGSGLGCGWPAGKACDGVARNPRRSTSISSSMIVGQAVAQSPSIFATVISLMLIFAYAPPEAALPAFGVCLGVGFAMGAGALGPGIGSGSTAGGAVDGASRWPLASAMTVRTMLIGQAVAQTPAIFGMLVAFIMMFALDIPPGIIGFSMTLGAGLSVGFGGIGPGIGSGIAGDYACQAAAARPRLDALILRTMLIGQAVSQSTAIYSLIIALLLLYVVG
jgi:F-type H+-transporting ATPase subunit c